MIEHGFFTDPDGHDERVILEGIELAHQLARTDQLAALTSLTPWSEGHREHSAILDAASGYWHPVGTCAMGPASDPMAVATRGAGCTGWTTSTSPTPR